MPKKKGKFITKKNFVKKGSPNKKQSKALLITLEEHSSDDSDEDEETSEVAAIATTFIPSLSLFKSPNENLPTNHIARCLISRYHHLLNSSPNLSILCRLT